MDPNAALHAPADPAASEPLIGLAPLMTMAFNGVDLAPLGARLIERAAARRNDANALMDLATLLQLQGNKDIGLAAQQQALQLQRLYRQPAARRAALRLLAIMAPGDLMANTPLEFLLQDSDVNLEMLYLVPGMPVPPLPEHDLVFVAVCESDQNRPLLHELDFALQCWPQPVCNLPGRIGRTSRELAHALLAGLPAVEMPVSVRLARRALNRVCCGEAALGAVLGGEDFPVVVRPVDSHAGHGLAKIDAPRDLDAYLHAMHEDEFYVSPYVDYRSPDGNFRKYRIVLIDGRPYAGHMGISAHWMIHYLNAGMSECAEKRVEEERFMASFDADFGLRHAAALASIAARIGLDYLVVDCGETADGKLLIFEIDPGAVVHCMDPADLFPYKHAQMRKVFTAFRDMLARAVGSDRSSGPSLA